MNSLLSLLSAQGANNIDVFGDASAPTRPETSGVLGSAVPPPNPEMLKEQTPRAGMFGVKGTLRDVIGTLGDAFLVQSGNAPMYAPRRREERIGDAMRGMTQDYDSMMQASERLAALGYKDEAVSVFDRAKRMQIEDDKRALEQDMFDQKVKEYAESTTRRDEEAQSDRVSNSLKFLSNLAQGANEANLPAFLSRARDVLSAYQLTPEEIEYLIPEGITLEGFKSLANQAEVAKALAASQRANASVINAEAALRRARGGPTQSASGNDITVFLDPPQKSGSESPVENTATSLFNDAKSLGN